MRHLLTAALLLSACADVIGIQDFELATVESECCPLLPASWEVQGCVARWVGPDACGVVVCDTPTGSWYSGEVCVHGDGSYEVR